MIDALQSADVPTGDSAIRSGQTIGDRQDTIIVENASMNGNPIVTKPLTTADMTRGIHTMSRPQHRVIDLTNPGWYVENRGQSYHCSSHLK